MPTGGHANTILVAEATVKVLDHLLVRFWQEVSVDTVDLSDHRLDTTVIALLPDQVKARSSCLRWS